MTFPLEYWPCSLEQNDRRFRDPYRPQICSPENLKLHQQFLNYYFKFKNVQGLFSGHIELETGYQMQRQTTETSDTRTGTQIIVKQEHLLFVTLI
jgi:hypothetical protein